MGSHLDYILFAGTQGLAVTYCCHGEEENKMMAIAQKCGLSLSALPCEFFYAVSVTIILSFAIS